MRSPQTQSPHPLIPTPHFHSTVSLQKLRRLNLLILVFRVVTFCFSLASSVFMVTNTHSSSSSSWSHFDSYRYVFAANAIVTGYSLLQMVASVFEVSRGVTLFPEVVQVWFDFTHDQVFAYLLLSAASAGTTEAKNMKGSDTCTNTSAFCLQSYISIGLGFAGFLFLGFSALLSAFRVVCFIINGSRFHL